MIKLDLSLCLFIDDYTDSQQVERISDIMKKTFTNFLSGTGLSPLPFPL
jgi:hypothetical protein